MLNFKFHRLLTICLVFWTSLGFAQDRVITGKVIARSNKVPLAGATIAVRGSSRSTSAAADGTFSLSLPSGIVTVIISSVGYPSQERRISAGEDNIVITLEESVKQLGDVIVVGYSDKKRSELTSAVSVVSEDKLKDVTTNDLGSMLQGKVAGLQVVNSSGAPGSAAEIRIRGVSSVNASASPLIVVDGIIGGNYDPNDVESVTVLKDAGATAMYGSEANGGVIIVSTKRGKSYKPRFEAKATMGYRTANFGSMKLMNGGQLYQAEKELYRDYIPGDSSSTHLVDILKFYNDRPLSLLKQDHSWLDAMFKRAFVQNYYLSASGRTEKSDYYLGLTYYNEKGTFIQTDYQRLNVRGNSTYHFNRSISVSNNINLSAAMGHSYDESNLQYAYLNLPWDNPFDSSGKPVYVDGASTFAWWSRDKINPLYNISQSSHPYKGFDLNYDLSLNADITSWLSLSSTNRFAAAYNNAQDYYSPLVAGTYHGTGYLNNQSTLNYGLVSNQLLKFKFQEGDHRISGLAGVAFENSRQDLSGGSGKGLPEGLAVLNVVSNTQQVNGSSSKAMVRSFISQVNYSYLERYFLTGSYRVDGSSAFPPANQYARFPAVSAAWLLSKESFLRDSKEIDYLKLRLSYGVTGTQSIGASRYLGLFTLTSQYNSLVGATPSQLPSPNLTWESKYQWNGGIDIGIVKRINLTVDAYHNVTRNLLLQVAQPLSIGIDKRWTNTGQAVNDGIELGLNTVNIQTKNFTWDMDINVNINRNRLRQLPDTFTNVYSSTEPITQIYRNGGNLYEFYMPKWAGVDRNTGAPLWVVVDKDAQGNFKGTHNTSDITQATYQEVGSALPKWQGGFNNHFRYRNFSLVVNTYFIYGNKVFSNALRSLENDGQEPLFNQIVLPSGYSVWTKPGDNASEPSRQNNANSTDISTRYLKNGSYWSIRNITFSYDLPAALIDKLKMNAVTISLSADNVYTFTKFLGQDPQTTISSAQYIMPGVLDFKYPNNRQFLFNINIRF
jgi:TonB-linked SusC/RagA family outer membrane protein